MEEKRTFAIEPCRICEHSDGTYGLTMVLRNALITTSSSNIEGNTYQDVGILGITRANMVTLANHILDAAAKLEP